MTTTIGFIGLGKMGGPMAGRLLDAGHSLQVFDTRRDAMQPFVARGAQAASSIGSLASAVETVLVSLPTPAVVKEVAIGANGIATGTKVKTFVDLSTTGPRVAKEIAGGLASRNIAALDAPVSGGVNGAVKGTLAVMVSGARERAEALRPVLEVFGKFFYMGEQPGLGQTMKLANNLLSATALVISAEAIVMGVKAGLDPKLMLDVINAGSGRNSATQDKFPKSVLPRTFDFGFTNALMYKDVKLCFEEAEAMGVPMWVAAAVKQMWFQACADLGPEEDFTSIVKWIEKTAGVEVKGR